MRLEPDGVVHVVVGVSTSPGIFERRIYGVFTDAAAAGREHQRQRDFDSAKAAADAEWYRRAAAICGVSGKGGLPRIPPEAGPRPSTDYGMAFRVIPVPLNQSGCWDMEEKVDHWADDVGA